MQSVLFLIGLLVACVIAIVIGNFFSFFQFEIKTPSDSVSMCHTLSFIDKDTVSLLPLSTVIYTYALSYLGIPILHNHRNNTNLPILVFFPVITFLDILWNYLFGCSTLWNLFAAGVVGLVIGLSWAELLFQSSFKNFLIDSILTDDDICEARSATGFKCVQRSQEPVDPPQDVSGDIANNMMLASYRYLTNMYKQDVNYLRKTVRSELNMLNNVQNQVEAAAGIQTPASQGYVIFVHSDAESPGIDYHQETEHVKDPTACKTTCDAATDQCMSFTYDAAHPSCMLKKGVAYPLKSPDKSYFVPMKTGYLYMPNTVYAAGSDVLTTLSGVTDPNTCMDRCKDNKRCVGVQVEFGSNTCSLRSGLNPAGPYYDPLGQFLLNIDATSHDASSGSTATYDVYPGIHFTGGITTSQPNVTDVTSCYVTCNNDDNCAGFYYNASTQTCGFHDTTNPYDSAETDISYNTYVKVGTAPAKTFTYAMKQEANAGFD